MEHEAPFTEQLDLNFATNKNDQGSESAQHEDGTPENNVMEMDAIKKSSGSPVLPAFVNNEKDEQSSADFNTTLPASPLKKNEESSFALESNLYPDDIEARAYEHNADGMTPVEDYNYREQEETINYVDHPGNYESGNISRDSQLEKTKLSNQEMDGGNFSHQTEANEVVYPPGMVSSDNGDDNVVVEANYDMPSQFNRDGMPSPDRQFSVSRERSPHTEPAGQEEHVNREEKLAHSPNTLMQKHSPSPEKHGVGRKRPSSRDHASPSKRRRSPSGRTSLRDSHQDYSPRKRLSRSPRRRELPRRKDRSVSRSPARERDSSGHRRDRHGRSRSRSPYRRDRHQRSPRYSPRLRSPPSGYYSRRRSPRRPWSPPANRSTGIGKPGRNLFVAGFSYGTTERDLERKFSRFGQVTDVRIVRDKRSGDSRGFGFLSLERDEDADAAIRALDQTEWNSRIILVEKSKTSVR